jgi:hypothetical protein
MGIEPSAKLTRNAVRCKRCGDVIESKSTHDAVKCSCGACAVDGGLEYLRRLGHPDDYEELREYSTAWRKNGSSIEIRTRGALADDRAALDEIVASGASIHLEQMSHDRWFMGIEAGGKYFHLNFGLSDGELTVMLSDQDKGQSGEWEGDSRERREL